MFHNPTPREALRLPGQIVSGLTYPKLEPLGVVQEPLYRTVTLCKQHSSDVMIMMS